MQPVVNLLSLPLTMIKYGYMDGLAKHKFMHAMNRILSSLLFVDRKCVALSRRLAFPVRNLRIIAGLFRRWSNCFPIELFTAQILISLKIRNQIKLNKRFSE